MQDIHDIKGLIEIPVPWLSFILLGLFVLSLLTVAAWAIWRWRQKRKDQPVQAKPINKEDAYQQALRSLKQLDPQTQAASVFYFELELILKQFLQQTRDSVEQQSALSFTTSQLLSCLTENNLLTPDLQTCLQHGLYAKFAEQDLPIKTLQDDQKCVFSWFENHKRTLIAA